MDISLQTEIEQIRIVESGRNYWFVRTYGGYLYDFFRENSFIGFGLNNIPYQYIKEAKLSIDIENSTDQNAKFEDLAAFKRLQNFISTNTSYKKGEATKWANQLIGFQHEMKLDDIVIIPSQSSNYLSIGIITSEVYIVDVKETFTFENRSEPYPEKRRGIKWLKEILKDEFRGSLNSMFFSRTAVKNVNDFSEIIESNLSTLYIKEEHIYLSINIDQDEEINAFDFQRFLEGLTYLYKEFCIAYGEDENEELYIKVRVQSKGSVVLKALAYSAVFSIAGIVALSNNSKVKLDVLGIVKFEGGSDGFLESFTKFKDAEEVRDDKRAKKALERQKELILFQDSIKKLKAKPIKDSVSKEEDKVFPVKKISIFASLKMTETLYHCTCLS